MNINFLIKEFYQLFLIYLLSWIFSIVLLLSYKKSCLFWFTNNLFENDLPFYFLGFLDMLKLLIYGSLTFILPIFIINFLYIIYIFFINSIKVVNIKLNLCCFLICIFNQIIAYKITNVYFFQILLKILMLSEINNIKLQINIIYILSNYVFIFFFLCLFNIILDLVWFLTFLVNTWRRRISNINKLYLYGPIVIAIMLFLPPDIVLHFATCLFFIINIEYRLCLSNIFTLLKN